MILRLLLAAVLAHIVLTWALGVRRGLMARRQDTQLSRNAVRVLEPRRTARTHIPAFCWMRVSALLVAVLSSFLVQPPALAHDDGTAVRSVSQSDQTDDGLLDATIIDCAFATDHDLIYVVDQDADMEASSDWREATDFDDDIWLYDIGADGSVQLIVLYRTEDGHEVAYLYDDQDGDGQVRYVRDGTKITVLESPYWSAHIESGSTWFLPNGRLNLNLRVELDGPMHTFDRMPEWYVQSAMRHDGVADAEFESVAGPDGIARYAVLRLLAASPPEMRWQRTGLWSNNGRQESRPFARAFFPFLPAASASGEGNQPDLCWFETPPMVSVDWALGKVQAVGLPGIPNEHGWICNDDEYLELGRVNNVSFECPMAYYDLAGDRDASPELNIRMFYYPSGDPSLAIWMPFSQASLQEIYYSWSQENQRALSWDYKLGLAGTYTIEEVEQFPNFALRKVPFEEFPGWITSRAWDLTTFVARENREYSSGEGIWDWNPLAGPDPNYRGDLTPKVREMGLQYMLGLDSRSPEGYFTAIAQGFRGERNFSGPEVPRLYFSPVDRKLHLLGAEWGVWQIDDTASMQYADRTGDGRIDEWQFLEAGAVRRQLNVLADYALYAGSGNVTLKRASVPVALFEAAPPASHEEWLALGEQLDQHRRDFAPGDLASMLELLDGESTQIEGAAARDVRATAHGFRFILDLEPGFHLLGEDWLGVGAAEPGRYIVQYDGAFATLPWAPPQLRLEPLKTSSGGYVAYTPGQIALAVRNAGPADASTVLLELDAPQAGQLPAEPLTQTLSVRSGETVVALFEWAPPGGGTWSLRAAARALGDGGALLAEAAAGWQVEAEPPEEPPLAEFLSAFGNTSTVAVVLLLGAAALTGSLILPAALRRTQQEADPRHDPPPARCG